MAMDVEQRIVHSERITTTMVVRVAPNCRNRSPIYPMLVVTLHDEEEHLK
jgi:hypothetical protein